LDAVKRNILILTSDLGFGHRSAANAIREALLIRYGDAYHPVIVNPMKHPKVPSFYRENPQIYDLWVQKLPELYTLSYKSVDKPLAKPLIENFDTTMLLEAMLDIIRKVKPAVIVVTRDSYLSTLWAIRLLTRRRLPVITVVTDLGTVHRLWFHRVSTITCVPSQRVYEMALNEKIPPAQLRLTGIAVHPAIAQETRSKAELRVLFGWRTDLKTVLIVGSKRVRTLIDAVRVLNHLHLPLQFVISAGGDEALYAQLEKMAWHHPAHLYPFVREMPQFLRAADVLVAKAGGLIVTEGLAAGLPILLIDAIEGQETGNVAHVVEGGAGAFAPPPLDLLETVYDWFQDDFKMLEDLAARARALGHPNAAFEIAELVHGYATGQLLMPVDRGAVRAQQTRRSVYELRDWLNRLLGDSEG
jgi:UDP-N-acetylglucosamine:LPS N-acetylglucosamine transferase